MNFEFSDDQLMLRDQARRFLADKCSLGAVREILDGDAAYDKNLWRGIAEMGWTATAIPEAYGGIGLGYLELCIIAEELGRALAPVPFSSSIYLAADIILRVGSEEQKQKYLPKLAAGESVGAFVVAEGAGFPTPAKLTARFKDGTLSGVKAPVMDGDIADFAIVAAKISDDPTEASTVLCLVDLSGKGVSREIIETIDPTRSHAKLSFDNAPAEVLGAVGDGWTHAQAALDRAAALIAFEQVGGADRCLEIATEYAKERYAFGRQIGSFQAVKHHLADMYVNNVIARSNAYYGAWALSTDAAELPLAAAGARIAASDAYDLASTQNIQTHGGMGMTWEVDCHLFYRRARLLALSLGSTRHWSDRLVSKLEQRNAA